MKKVHVILFTIITSILLSSCSTDEVKLDGISEINFRVNLKSLEKDTKIHQYNRYSKSYPDTYKMTIKSATLIGGEDTDDFLLFDRGSLMEADTFDFNDKEDIYTFISGIDIPSGKYKSLDIEIYWTEMNIAIATVERGVERRNWRMYYTDDQEEGGEHRKGDIVQMNGDQQEGWTFGRNILPNFDPVSNRTTCYEGLNFNGQNYNEYGPLGDRNFLLLTPSPYLVSIPFTDKKFKGTKLFINADFSYALEYRDYNQDGEFGGEDLVGEFLPDWLINIPEMGLSLEK